MSDDENQIPFHAPTSNTSVDFEKNLDESSVIDGISEKRDILQLNLAEDCSFAPVISTQEIRKNRHFTNSKSVSEVIVPPTIIETEEITLSLPPKLSLEERILNLERRLSELEKILK